MAGPSKSPPDAFQEFFVAARGGLGLTPVNLSMAQIVEATSPKWTNIAFGDNHHKNAYGFDRFLQDNNFLSALNKAGVRTFLDEVDHKAKNNYEKLLDNQMDPKDFSDAVHVNGWVDNPAHYEQASYVPLLKSAKDHGITFKPADVNQTWSKELNMSSDVYFEMYVDFLDPAQFSIEDKARLFELFPMQGAEMAHEYAELAETMPPSKFEDSLAQKYGFTPQNLSENDQKLIQRFAEQAATLPQPFQLQFSEDNILEFQTEGMGAHVSRHFAAQDIAESVDLSIRSLMDSDVARLMESEAPDQKRAIRFGITHFNHNDDLDQNLHDKTLIVGVFKDAEEYTASLSRKMSPPHLAYMLDEGRAYTTEATPPDIMESIREKENGIETSAAKPALQTDYSVVTP